MAPSTPEGIAPDSQQLEQRLRALARLFDSAVRIPGTRVRVGLDAVIGLIPGVGDLAGLVLGLWLIWQARQLQAPAALQWRLIGNLGVEAVLGSVPLLGDLFDIAWRANQRNVELLLGWAQAEARAEDARQQGSPPWRWLLALAVLLGIAAYVLL